MSVHVYFCTIEEVRPFLTENLKLRTEEEWITASRNGDFPPVFNINGVNLFRKSAVLKYAQRVFGDRSDLIDQMKAAGFVPPE